MRNLLPNESPDRRRLHDEIHARPVGKVPHPSMTLCVAVLNDGVSRESEIQHLINLVGQHQALSTSDNFLRLPYGSGDIKWERHTEFTRYTLVQPLRSDEQKDEAADATRQSTGQWLSDVRSIEQSVADWFSRIPGQTIAAVELTVLAVADLTAQRGLALGSGWCPGSTLLASWLGNRAHSLALTDFRVQDDGIERILVLTKPDTPSTRVGRTVQRLLEMEVYRLMALRGLPVAKELSARLSVAEDGLAVIAREVEDGTTQDPDLLDQLAALASTIERAHADHNYRFSATAAYNDIVNQRVRELRETPVSGVQTIGEFMQRRLAPAMATVAATAKRLDSLSQRIGRVSDLLRTRVDIVTEQQNQQLLEKLTRGQALQLKLQQTVEGLSIAAISYYVVSLIYYLAKAAKEAHLLELSPEVVAGVAIVPTAAVVWQVVRRIHRSIAGH